MESVDRGLLKVAKRAELVRSARLVALAAAIPVAGFVVAGPGSSHDDDVFDLLMDLLPYPWNVIIGFIIVFFIVGCTAVCLM